MTDYVIGVGFETNAAVVKRTTDQVADSVEGVGKAHDQAAKSVENLASVSSQLERIQQRIVIQQDKLAQATSRVQRFQQLGRTSSAEYTKALEAQLQAQDRLASSILKADKLQERQAAGGSDSSGSGGGGSKLGAQIAAGVAGFVSADALTKLAVDSIEKAGELRATLQQNQQIFGANAQEIEAIGKNSASALGLSRQAAIAAADSYGTLFQTLHVGQAEAAGMSRQLVQVGVDVAAFEKADPSDVFEALRGGLSGQYDALQKYSVFLNAATVKQEAMRLGLVHGTGAISQTAQATAAYSLIIKQTADRQGEFANGADEVARKQAIAQAKLADAKTELGKGLIPAYLALADVATHTVVPALSGIAKVINAIVQHDTARHMAEIVVAAVALNAALGLGAAAVDRVSAAYVRLTGAAGAATVAERGAAGAAVGAGGARAAGAAGAGVLGPVAIGLLLASAAQGPEKALANDAKRRGGTSGRVEEIAANLLIYTNGVTLMQKAWNKFKAKAEETKKTVEDTVTIDKLGAAFEKAQARIEVLAAAQEKANRAMSYSARAAADTRALAASAASQPIPGLFDAAPDRNIDMTSLRENVRSARQAVALAQEKAASGGRTATASQIASAEASVASARAAARKPGGNFEAEQARLRAAEVRLAELRQGGNKTARDGATAEKSLADARERLRKANKELADGEEKLNGLSAATVEARSSKNKATAEAEVRNVKKLVAAGLTSDVIEDLKKLETTAPGTIANVAKALTPAMVRQLNHDAAARRKAAQDLASLGGEAVHNDAVRRARQLAKDQAEAYKNALLAAIKDPKWLAEVRSALGTLLVPGGVPGVPGSGAPPKGNAPSNNSDLTPLFPPANQKPVAPVPGQGRHGEAQTAFHGPTHALSPSTVHLSSESVAAVGNHVRAGAAVTSKHQNVFPNVTNFPAATAAAERAERNSRIGGG